MGVFPGVNHHHDPITPGSEVPGPNVPSGVLPRARVIPAQATTNQRTRNGCGQLTPSGGSLQE
jgi:hypothetical protein